MVNFGDKEFKGVGFPTPVSIPETTNCRVIPIPASGDWQALVMGALYALTLEQNWQQFEGGIDRCDAAARAAQMIDETYALALASPLSSCEPVPPPFWDEPDASDAENEPDNIAYPFYERLQDWVIAGFVAIASTPAAALEYLAIAPRFRLLFRARDWGAIAEIFLDNVSQGTIDTYSPVPDVSFFDVVLPPEALETGAMLRIEHTGEHNENATPQDGSYNIEIIRKRLFADEIGNMLMLRQNPENSCEMQQSNDGGETWYLAFDYSLCVPSTINDILQIVNDTRSTQIEDFSILEININAPTLTWISSSMDDSTGNNERATALCALAQWLSVGVTETIAQVQEDNITAGNVVAASLGIALGVISVLFPPAALVGAVKYAAFGGVLAGGALAIFGELSGGDPTILRDPDIREFVGCEIYKDLLSKPVTEDAIATFLSGDYSCFTADEQRAVSLVRQSFRSTPRRRALFNAMVDYLGDVTAAQKAGILGASCVCATDTWSFDLDLEQWFGLTTLADMFYGGANNCTGGAIGQNAGMLDVPYWDSTAFGGGQGLGRKFSLFVPASTTVTQVHVTAQNTVALGGNNLNIMSNSQRRCVNYSAGSASNVFSITPINDELWELGVSTFGAAAGDGALRITMVRISGTGVPLFAGC